MKRLAIPLASYLAVTIVVPVLNGAPTDAAFLEHVGVTVALALLIAIVLTLPLEPRKLFVDAPVQTFVKRFIRNGGRTLSAPKHRPPCKKK